MASCLPPGGPRQFQMPYGIQILEEPEKQRVFVMSGGGNRNWRLIHLDGRAHQPDDLLPTYYGDSVAQWEGDTLVIDSWFQRTFLVQQRRLAAHGEPAPHGAAFPARFQHTKI